MTSLSAIGEALYGPRWQTSLAQALQVSDRTVRRWAAGTEPPEGVFDDLRTLLERRVVEIQKLLKS